MSHEEMYCLWCYLYAHFHIGGCDSLWPLNPVERPILVKKKVLVAELLRKFLGSNRKKDIKKVVSALKYDVLM